MFRQAGLHWLVRSAGLFVLALAMPAASAAPLPNVHGNWLTANGHGVVQIARCGDELCGRIVAIDRAAGEPMPTAERGRPQCGRTIITADKGDSAGAWRGQITDPRDGHSYQARLSVDQRGDLRLRVFIGIPVVGSTQVWQPFIGHRGADCRIA